MITDFHKILYRGRLVVTAVIICDIFEINGFDSLTGSKFTLLTWDVSVPSFEYFDS